MIITKGNYFKGLYELEHPVTIDSVIGAVPYDNDGEIRAYYNGDKSNVLVSYRRYFNDGGESTFTIIEKISESGDFSLSKAPWGNRKRYVTNVEIEVTDA